MHRSVDLRQGFCCLGVLCDLAAKDGGPQWDQPSKIQEAGFLGHTCGLPPVVLEFMGMTEDHQDHLISMNDDYEVGFKKIATYIREEIMPAALKHLSKSR
jgi:hypothetical protein